MKRKQVTAVLVSLVMAVSAFLMPFAGAQGYAAESVESFEEVLDMRIN